MADQVKVKKVKAYPFPLQIMTDSGVIQGQVVKLTLQGFLAEVPSSALQTGEKVQVSFELPVLHAVINEPGVMVKLYTQWGGRGQTQGPAEASSAASNVHHLHLIEIHFKPLSIAGSESISTFLRSLNKTS